MPVVEVIPYPLIILLVLAVAASWLMRRPFGRSLIAAGDNPEAAHLSGTPLWWLKTRAFMLSSLSATVAGILLVGYAGVHPSVGPGLRVHRDHRRRARRRAARRRPRLGALGRGRRLRARAALHPAHRPRRRVDLARHRAGPDHHRRRRRRRPRLAGRPPAARPSPATAHEFHRSTRPNRPPRARTQETTDAQTKSGAPSRPPRRCWSCSRPAAPTTRWTTPTPRPSERRGDRRRARSGSSRRTSTSRTRSAPRPSRVTPSSPGCSTSTVR